MMRRSLTTLLSLPLLLWLPSCGSGGGGSSTTTPTTAPPGSVQVVLDTTAGTEIVLQGQVVAASLRATDGSLTPNLLASPQVVTFADPAGQPGSLTLRGAPEGSYGKLHLMLAAGSAQALLADGTTVPVDVASVDLEVAFGEPAAHSRDRVTWLRVQHADALALTMGAGRAAWTPHFQGGRADGTELGATLQVMAVRNGGATCLLGDGALHVSFGAGADLRDSDDNPIGDVATFLAGCRAGDDLQIDGTLDDSGGLRCHRARHRGGNREPRLIGRILELLPREQSFRMLVLAEARRGGERNWLPTPQRMLVRAENAHIRFSHTWRVLTFADLQVDDLVKVEWTRRSEGVLVAREIEVTHRGGQPILPEFQGAVAEVNLTERTLVLVPRRDDPILVGGQSVDRLLVRIGERTELIRQERRGGGRSVIRLEDIVVGQDRAWVRGELVERRTVAASRVRVRDDS